MKFKQRRFILSIFIVMLLVNNVFAQTIIKNDENNENNIIKKVIKNNVNDKEKQIEVRTPNKLTAKEPPQDNNKNTEKTNNKGVRTEITEAKATMIENVDNKNKNYKIYRNQENIGDNFKYSADARQFLSFKTKNGKTFHLIINHDEDTNNVMLLTEVSEDDLINFTDNKKQKIEKIDTKDLNNEVKTANKGASLSSDNTNKTQENSVISYIIMFIIAILIVLGTYYMLKLKKQEKKDLEEIESDYYINEIGMEDIQQQQQQQEEEEEIENEAENGYSNDYIDDYHLDDLENEEEEEEVKEGEEEIW